MTINQLREEWQTAIEEIDRRRVDADWGGDLQELPNEEEDHSLIIERTRIYSGKCHSLLSYVKT